MSEAIGQPFRHHRAKLPPHRDIDLRHARLLSGNDIVHHDFVAALANDIALMNLAILCRQLKSNEALLNLPIGIENGADDKFKGLRRPQRTEIGPDPPSLSIDRMASRAVQFSSRIDIR